MFWCIGVLVFWCLVSSDLVLVCVSDFTLTHTNYDTDETHFLAQPLYPSLTLVVETSSWNGETWCGAMTSAISYDVVGGSKVEDDPY